MTIKRFLPVFIGLLTVSPILFSSCKQEGCTDEAATNYDSDADDDDGSCIYPADNIVFNVSNPAVGSTFSLGDTVHIDAMITTDGDVHGYELYIRNTSHDDMVVFQKEVHAHESPVHIHEMWVNDVDHHSDMELEIVLVADHDGSKESHKVNFHCHPM